MDLIGVTDVVQEVHEGGKICVAARTPVENVDDLGLIYTPGVASICRQIHDDPELAYRFTVIPNSVAIVTKRIAAATAIARFAEGTELVPDILRKEVHEAVASAVAQAAYRTGVVKPEPDVEG